MLELPESRVLVLYALFALVRQWNHRTLWSLPTLRGPDWLFDAHVGVDHPSRPRLLRSYRRWILGSSILIEAVALADTILFGSLLRVVLVQGPLTLLLGILRRLVLRAFILRARDLLAPHPGARTTLSLRPRTLRAYTNAPFEFVNAALVAASLAALGLAGWPSPVLVVLLLYCQLGGILRKVALLRRPVPLPAEDADAYLRVIDDAFRYGMRMLDVMRASFTFALCLLAAKATWWGAWSQQRDAAARVVLGGLVVLTVVLLVIQARRGRSLLARAGALPVPVPRPPLSDPENLHLGGLVYANADNPSVVVDGGPLRLAINLLNGTTYMYVAYWIGLGALISFLAVNS